jgi:SAM-dependent methyltransferase
MAQAKFPQSTFALLDNGAIPLPDSSVDVVMHNLVYSSILESGFRRAAAAEAIRVLRPGGVILLCDFTVNNPANPDVRALHTADIARLFPDCRRIYFKRVVLEPSIARIVVPRSWIVASILEVGFPMLRTHMVVALRKP